MGSLFAERLTDSPSLSPLFDFSEENEVYGVDLSLTSSAEGSVS